MTTNNFPSLPPLLRGLPDLLGNLADVTYLALQVDNILAQGEASKVLKPTLLADFSTEAPQGLVVIPVDLPFEGAGTRIVFPALDGEALFDALGAETTGHILLSIAAHIVLEEGGFSPEARSLASEVRKDLNLGLAVLSNVGIESKRAVSAMMAFLVGAALPGRLLATGFIGGVLQHFPDGKTPPRDALAYSVCSSQGANCQAEIRALTGEVLFSADKGEEGLTIGGALFPALRWGYHAGAFFAQRKGQPLAQVVRWNDSGKVQ